MKKKQKKRVKVTLVVWYDAVAETGWITDTEAKTSCKLDKCVSIGYLVDKNQERILLACTKSDNQYNALINIPNAWIETIKEYNL
tara:strand:+ start:557 stop:811 length:255 start_codon:yes stop_codon:yes gene_type:complete